MPLYLTLVDTLKIQDFIFASNRLIDAITGSYQIATELPKLIRDLLPDGNIIYCSAGNALLRFGNEPAAKRFAARLTRRLADDIPGLEVVIDHIEHTDGYAGQLIQDIKALYRKVERRKLSNMPSSPLLGLGVTARCAETGLPATSISRHADRGLQTLAEMIDRRRRNIDLKQVEKPWLGQVPAHHHKLEFPRKLDELGRSHGETSYIGLVHIDGNNVGNWFLEWLDLQSGAGDDAVLEQLGECSRAVDEWARSGMTAILGHLCQDRNLRNDLSISGLKDKLCVWSERLQQGFPLIESAKGGSWFLPIRPILAAGDDLTFVCDGRIALDLATVALQHMNRRINPRLPALTAAAGVAIVHAHTPLARAFRLAEQLCRNAKRHLGRKTVSLDWHIESGATIETLDQLRERQYRTAEPKPGSLPALGHSLTCRPMTLPFWKWLDQKVLGDSGNGFHAPFWQERRNKLKSLQECLVQGESVTNATLKAWGIETPLPGDYVAEGAFSQDQTPFLDALELLDLHFPLVPVDKP